LANYEQVKLAIRTWQAHTDLGKTKITVSTVGLLVPLEKILTDPEWPEVRLAVSLHSADPRTRQEIVPTSAPDFLPKLADWARRYARKYGNRRHHLTFEYVMLGGVNDTPAHAKALGEFAAALGRVKVNVIPYNRVPGKPFSSSEEKSVEQFKSQVRSFGVDVTQRRTMGDDIAAACGQLVIGNAGVR
jgi:23S rRNA (adenine2503-C2)-methyltransferase